MKVLIADDERDLCAAIQKIVQRHGHECIAAYDGFSAIDLFARERVDLVVLDVMMPEINGFELCRKIRDIDAKVPIIILSAKSDVVDKSVGFSAGCDDYVTKPFNTEELWLRIEAGLRRARINEDGGPRYRRRSIVRLGDLEVRLKRNEVLLRGERVNVTPKEFQIIAFLANHPGEVFTAQSIMEGVWGESYMPGSSSIAVFVRKIRNKIEDDPAKPRYLQTVWREGYRLGDESMIERSEDDVHPASS